MKALKVDKVHASYGQKEILRDLSLFAGEGDIIAIIGPNGAGKSTFLKVIAGFLKPTSGGVWLDDVEMTHMPPHKRANLGLGYFMQGGRVFPDLTIKENLSIHLKGLFTKGSNGNFDSVMELYPKLKNLLDRRAGLLSGGERHMLAMAMVLIKKPPVLLLDEPSAGLSPQVVSETVEKIFQINRAWGVTILLVEQNIKDALDIASKAVMLVNGQIVLQSETPSDLLNGGLLEDVFLGKTNEIGMPGF